MIRRKPSRQPSRDDRIYAEKSDNRNAFQRDRDRILYTSAFQRLAEVTQVVSAHEGHVFHNRLTHSLKVAQVGRRIAEVLRSKEPSLSLIDPDVVEAAALAHDLGHPPFGHVAEVELDDLMAKAGLADGFEGNAQSFRIVAKLAMRREGIPGLNLTRATLRALLKYPWLRAKTGMRNRKWGAYDSERNVLGWACHDAVGKSGERSIEAEIMDWADDVTYAVHDLDDFYRADLIPLDLLCRDEAERRQFLDGTFTRNPDIEKQTGFRQKDLETVFEGFLRFFPLQDRYLGIQAHRAALRSLTAGMISMFVRSVDVAKSPESGRISLKTDSFCKKIVIMLKELTWHYVILHPSLATQQYGEKKIIRTLFEIFVEAATKPKKRNLFPYAFRELIDRTTEDRQDPRRIVCDFIASMSEKQATALYQRLSGVSLGSAMDSAVR